MCHQTELLCQLGNLQALVHMLEQALYMLEPLDTEPELVACKQQPVAVHMFPLLNNLHRLVQGRLSALMYDHNDLMCALAGLALRKLARNYGHFHSHKHYHSAMIAHSQQL